MALAGFRICSLQVLMKETGGDGIGRICIMSGAESMDNHSSHCYDINWVSCLFTLRFWWRRLAVMELAAFVRWMVQSPRLTHLSHCYGFNWVSCLFILRSWWRRLMVMGLAASVRWVARSAWLTHISHCCDTSCVSICSASDRDGGDWWWWDRPHLWDEWRSPWLTTVLTVMALTGFCIS